MTPTNDAPVTVEDREAAALVYEGLTAYGVSKTEGMAASIRDGLLDDNLVVQALRRHRLAALASAPAGDGVDQEAAQAYFERGFMACYAWQFVNKGAELSDAVIDHAWDNREQGGELPALARPRAAVGERYTGQGFLTPASGLDEDGMCNEHGRQGCRACVDDLLTPLAEQAAAMPYRDGVIRIIAEAGKLNEGGHADWSVHAEAFADMILALQAPPAKVDG